MLQVHFCFSFFFCFFQYGQSNINNSQKHGLKTCYGENKEYKESFPLILAVPLLPHWFIPRAVKYLFFRCINFQNNADCKSFGWYKICLSSMGKEYQAHKFCKQDQATNNGPKNYFKYVKSEIKVRKSI